MKTMRKLTSVILILALALAFPVLCLAEDEPVRANGYRPSVNGPVFDAELLKHQRGGEALEPQDTVTYGRYSGISFEDGTSPYSIGSDRSYNADHSENVTPVKNQGGLNTCWIFSGIGTFESAVLKQYSETMDFSEMYMYYAASNYPGVLDNPYPADHDYDYDADDFTTFYGANEGGNENIIMAYLARGNMGAVVDETVLEYDSHPTQKTLLELQRIGNSQATSYYPSQMITLGENLEYTGNNYNAEIGAAYIRETKDLIKAFGSVSAGYYDDRDSSDYAISDGYKISAYAVYSWDSFDTNHQIQIVGWDDDHGSSGAFLVKNSWGTSWNDSGYFWMSYDCYYTGVMAIATVSQKPDLFDKIYETDSSVPNYQLPIASSKYVLLERTYKTGDETEDLTGIMIYNHTPGMHYSIYVTDDDTVASTSAWTRPSVVPDNAVSYDEARPSPRLMQDILRCVLRKQ